jgi:hypothetical protein
MSKEQYLGVIYRYAHTTTSPIETATDTQVPSVLYTFAPSHKVSVSLTAGPEFYSTAVTGAPKSSSIGSFVLASTDLHGAHTGLAATYSQAVTAGQGLVGAYSTYLFDLSGRWEISRVWRAAVSGQYLNQKQAIPEAVPIATTPGGHSVYGMVSVSRLLGPRLAVNADYRRLHQGYDGVAVLSNSGNDDRVSISLSYQFRTPIGR